MSTEEKLEAVVRNLSDPYEWNWARMISHRDAADGALMLLAKIGLIEHSNHPLGGHIWTVNGNKFGRVDT